MFLVGRSEVQTILGTQGLTQLCLKINVTGLESGSIHITDIRGNQVLPGGHHIQALFHESWSLVRK